MFLVSNYDQYPSNGRKSRVTHWLKQERWTLMQAAMLFCDIAPDLATVDDQSHLVSCVSLRNELYGDSEERFAEMREFESEEEESSDDDDENGGNHARPVKFLAGQLADMLQTLHAALAAGTAQASWPPVSWVTYAEEKGIDVPWLVWARSKPREFPWLQSEARRTSVGWRSDVESPTPALDRPAIERTVAARGKNAPSVWKEEARLRADKFHLIDQTAGAYSSTANMAERVAKSLRGEGIEGPRGPLTAENVRREALQGTRWKRRSR